MKERDEIVYRGDGRAFDEIFRSGFSLRTPPAGDEIKYLPFISRNALSTSLELGAAAVFPLNMEEESFIYIIRTPSGAYNLYAESLVKLQADSSLSSNVDEHSAETIAELAWANEYSFSKKIPPENIIGGMKIRREPIKDLAMSGFPGLVSFFILLEYRANPYCKGSLSTSEKLIIKKIFNDIKNHKRITTQATTKISYPAIYEAGKFFTKNRRLLTVGEDKRQRLSTSVMIFAAVKAKFIAKEKLMRQFLTILYNKANQPAPYTQRLINYFSHCRSTPFKRIDLLFKQNNILTAQSIHELAPYELKALFADLRNLYEHNDDNIKKFLGQESIAQLDHLIHEIDQNNHPRLTQ